MPAKPQKCKENRTLGNVPERHCGGDGGIRTHDRVTPIHTFQACAFDHSATSPHIPSGRTPLAAPLRFRKAA